MYNYPPSLYAPFLPILHLKGFFFEEFDVCNINGGKFSLYLCGLPPTLNDMKLKEILRSKNYPGNR